MTCQLCGSQNCAGFCRQGMMGGQAQMANQQGYINIHNQQALINRLQAPFPSPPTPEQKFMELIDGKSDEEIVIAFEILVADTKKKHQEMLDAVNKQFTEGMQNNRDNFLSMCKRFRPSIDEKLLERVSKLKAFW